MRDEITALEKENNQLKSSLKAAQEDIAFLKNEFQHLQERLREKK